jgi:CubicO group peptidase (beta-lactamase class C family)
VRVVILAAAALVGGATSLPADESLAASVDAIAAEALKRPVAGMSVAVGRGGQVVLAKGYGFANVELEVAARPDTVYHVDSITKFLTAAAVLKLAEEGRLGLDDDVGRWVPGFSMPERPVRIRHLLSHTSGLASYTSQPDVETKERLDLGPEEVLGPLRSAPAHFAPGEGWRYCNTGFYLLGMVIEKVTGKAYGQYMRDEIFQPLGMEGSRYGEPRPLIRSRAAGYEVEGGHLVNGPLMSWRLPFSGGAIVSTALDLLKWTDALGHGRVLKPESLRAMWSPSRLADGTPIDYGLGTRLGALAGHRMVGHTGNGGGFKNALLFFPDDDLTVVVLSNTDAGSPLGVAARVAREVLRLAADAPPDRPLAPGAAQAYGGTFESDEGRVTFFARDGEVRFREKDDDVVGIPLRYLGEDTFALGDTVGRFLMKDGRARANAVYTGGLFMDAMMRVP